MIKKAIILIREKQVKKVRDNVFYVKDYRVELKKLNGRSIIVCSCEHHSKFPNEPSMCSHKIAALFGMVFEQMGFYSIPFTLEKDEIKKTETFEGYDKCPKWLKDLLIRAVDGKCEDCNLEGDLEIHRILPGYKGGKYHHRNCKVLCKECHKNYAENW